ncbi:hypothetical protein DFJ74DRAFT_438378 [Hyaloraphidium curvatum]|nr:hypothetical protein DFJ74DRAFT_438378 [Hyaloraphidium curvatum]
MLREIDFAKASRGRYLRMKALGLLPSPAEMWRTASPAYHLFKEFSADRAPRLPQSKFYVRKLVLGTDPFDHFNVSYGSFSFGTKFPSALTSLTDLTFATDSNGCMATFGEADLSMLTRLEIRFYKEQSDYVIPINTKFGDLRELRYKGFQVHSLFAALERQRQDRVRLDIQFFPEPHREFRDVSDWTVSRIDTLGLFNFEDAADMLRRWSALHPRRIFVDPQEEYWNKQLCTLSWAHLVRRGSVEELDLWRLPSAALAYGLPPKLKRLKVARLVLWHRPAQFAAIEKVLLEKPAGCVLDVGEIGTDERALDEDSDPEASMWRWMVGPAQEAVASQ